MFMNQMLAKQDWNIGKTYDFKVDQIFARGRNKNITINFFNYQRCHVSWCNAFVKNAFINRVICEMCHLTRSRLM